MKQIQTVFCIFIIVLVGVFSPASDANRRAYVATLDNSVWQLSQDSRLACSLEHEIPNYGTAIFSSAASKKSNMAFELDLMRLPADYSLALVESVPPQWRPGVRPSAITQMQWRKQFNGDVDDKSAWIMLTELEKGHFPTLYYADWHNKNDRVSVALAATNFRPAYYDFLNCVDGLLPYGFEDLEYTVLNFEKNSTELDRASKSKLNQIKEYLKHDNQIDKISVKAYSSSWGGRYTNLKVSQRRAAEIKALFVEFGIPGDRISVEGFGEKRHVASNDTILGRAENRRVVIEMVKP